MSPRRNQLEAMRAFIEAELAKLSPESTSPPPSSSPLFMTVEEYAARIRVQPATVRRMVRDENLPPRPPTSAPDTDQGARGGSMGRGTCFRGARAAQGRGRGTERVAS